LAAEQKRNRQLLQAKEDAAKSSEAALEALRLDVEALTSTKEDLHAQSSIRKPSWTKHKEKRAS
jgi:hypothetical protein